MAVWTLETGSDYTQFYFPFKGDKTFFHKVVKNCFEDSKPAVEKWRTIYLRRGEPMKHPDFFEIDNTDVVAISQRSMEIFGSLLNNGNELLSIKTDAGLYYALNVINIVDCLNKEDSIYVATRDGTIVSHTLLEFDQDLLEGHAIFKIPELPYQIFVSDEIQELCEENFLQGLNFDPNSNLIWYPE